MARAFSPATAEQVVAAVDAVAARRASADASYVATFCDLPEAQAEAALSLATDLALIVKNGAEYETGSPLSGLASSPEIKVKAALLRITLESYEPFRVFRERLVVTSAADAAAQTKAIFDLDAHREEIRDTLVSLGTYSQALVTEGGGHYSPSEDPLDSPLVTLVNATGDAVAAEQTIRAHVGADAAAWVSYQDVISPLTDALVSANGDSRAAVMKAGNAIDSYLVALAQEFGTELDGAPGINAKIDKFDLADLPRKLRNVGKYLGHVRNAADHGVDQEVAAAWTIRAATGVEYVFVACSFVAATTERKNDGPYVI